MAFREFLSDRMGKTILEILIMTLTSVILFTTGTQSGVIALLIILICLIRITSLLVSFFICRSHLNELERIMSGLTGNICLPNVRRRRKPCMNVSFLLSCATP